jgi:predicted DNA-binding transcriptional regulator YafY
VQWGGGIQGTKLAESLQPAFERLSQQLEGKVSLRWNDLDEAFAIKKNAVIEADLTLFGKLAEAVLKQNEVSFRYRGIKAVVSTHRRIQPYHVGEISGGWYVIGYDPNRDGLRTLALQRMTGVKVLKTWFERPDDFSIGEHLGGGIGVWSGNADGVESIEVVIELHGWAARLVQERLWHPSQKITVLDDLGEKIQMTMCLGHLRQLALVVLERISSGAKRDE